MEQVGGATIDKALGDAYEGDFRQAELLSLPVTLVILVVAFGALLAAAVPVLLALTSVAAAMGLVRAGLAPAAGHRHHRERGPADRDGRRRRLLAVLRTPGAGGAGRAAARRWTRWRSRPRTSGRAVVVSGGTVAVAMAGMFLTGSAIFSSLAVGAILVVAVAVLGSITVLPAVLAGLGRWVDRPRVPLLHRLTLRPERRSRLWSALLRPALRRPVAALAVGAGALVAAGAARPPGMRTALPGARRPAPVDPGGAVVRPAHRRLPDRGRGARGRGPGAGRAGRRGPVGAARPAGRAGASPRFAAGGEPDLEVSADGRVSVLTLAIPDADDSPGAEQSLGELRGRAGARRRSAGCRARPVAVGGGTAASVDFSAVLSSGCRS